MKAIAQISLSQRDRAAIADAVGRLRTRFPVERVVLFGSKAHGSDDAESDIDLLVLTSRKLDWRERDLITDALFDVEIAHGVVLSTLVVSLDEWERGHVAILPIHDVIEMTGVLV